MDKKEDHLLKIGEFAERGGVSRRSLRHYEKLGLLTPETRTSGGFRLYRENDLFKLEVIKVFKELGFNLEGITEIISQAREKDKADREDQIDKSQEVLKEQLTTVENRLEELKNRRELIERALGALEQCRDCARNSCPEHCENRRYFL